MPLTMVPMTSEPMFLSEVMRLPVAMEFHRLVTAPPTTAATVNDLTSSTANYDLSADGTLTGNGSIYGALVMKYITDMGGAEDGSSD